MLSWNSLLASKTNSKAAYGDRYGGHESFPALMEYLIGAKGLEVQKAGRSSFLSSVAPGDTCYAQRS